jgi:hypothetical protein
MEKDLKMPYRTAVNPFYSINIDIKKQIKSILISFIV